MRYTWKYIDWKTLSVGCRIAFNYRNETDHLDSLHDGALYMLLQDM